MNASLSGKIKAQKPFEIFDFIAYAVTAVFVTVLFFAFVVIPTHSAAEGFKVLIDNVTVLVFKYDDNSMTVTPSFTDTVEYDNEAHTLTIYTDEEKSDYNVLYVDAQARSVKMIDANCSHSKDCVYFRPVTSDAGFIYCAPHKLTVLPLSSTAKTVPITG